MPSNQLDTAFAYKLIADNVTIGFFKQATFPTMHSFQFDAPLSMDQRLLDSLGTTLSVSRIDPFQLGDGVPEDLVLTVTPEANADLFRDWLSNGNTTRGGSLVFLNTALQTFFTIRFTGLRVRSVTPAFATH